MVVVDRNPMFFIATSRRDYEVERNPMDEGEIGRKERGRGRKGWGKRKGMMDEGGEMWNNGGAKWDEGRGGNVVECKERGKERRNERELGVEREVGREL